MSRTSLLFNVPAAWTTPLIGGQASAAYRSRNACSCTFVAHVERGDMDGYALRLELANRGHAARRGMGR